MIRYAENKDYKKVVEFIDNNFTKEGFGFVNRAQIKNEIERGKVIVYEDDGLIVGVRIGIDRLWNLSVKKEYRGKGIGKKLVEFRSPTTIRVKSDPIGHLSKKQKEEFVDPTEFYEKLGYFYWCHTRGKNFFQKGKDNKGQYHVEGEKDHIKIYKKKGSTLFG